MNRHRLASRTTRSTRTRGRPASSTVNSRVAAPPAAAFPIASLALAAFAIGCGGGSDEIGEGIVESLPELVLEEELRIGHTDDPDIGFSRLGSVDVDHEGRVYALDIQDREIRVYDPEGRELHRLGGPGSGPGEFEAAPRFGVRGDTLWAIESFMRRLTLFSRDGAVIGTGRFEGVPVGLPPPATSVGLVMPNLMGEDGSFLGHLSMWMSPSAAPSAPDPEERRDGGIWIPRVRFAATGEVADTAGWYPHRPGPSRESDEVRIGSTTHRIPPPPPASPLEVMAADGHFIVERPVASSGDVGTFRVTRMGVDGDTLFAREYRYRPVGYGEERLDRIAWRAVQIPTGAVAMVGGMLQMPDMPPDSANRFRRVRAALDYPAYQPPISSDHLGADGSLWLRREDDGGPTFRWIALDPNGDPVGRLELPREHRIGWSSGDTVWMIEPDEFDVPWLVRYRLETGNG